MKKRKKQLFKKETPFIVYEMISLISLAVSCIVLSCLVDGWWQTLLISLGTGLIASAIVSLAFWKIQREGEIRIARKRRSDFMEQFKILAYNIITDIDMAHCESAVITLCEYIKIQHRWFHDYYKRLVASNYSENETLFRIKQITDFIARYKTDIKEIFDARVLWEDGNFNEWQLRELKSFNSSFHKCNCYLDNENYEQTFLWFADFLEIFKRIMGEDKFNELQAFTLMKFSYNEDAELAIMETDFEQKETFFKFAKDFNRIRKENYKKYYGKEIVSPQGEQNNG